MLFDLLKRILSTRRKMLDARTGKILGEADQLAASGDVAGALRMCQAVPGRSGRHPDVLAMQGELLARLRRFQEARSALERALAQDGNHARALFLLGSIDVEQQAYVSAARLFERVIALVEPDAVLLTNYGLALSGLGDQAGARRQFQAALALSPSYVAALESLALSLINEKLFDQAMTLLDRAIEEGQNNSRIFRLKGFCLYKHYFEPQSAEPLFDQAEACGENEAQFWNERGECARDLGDYDRALAYYNKALALAPQHPVVTFNKALLGLMHEEYATAWQDYEARFEGGRQGKIILPAPRWQGGALLGGRLFVIGEQGIGDEIMFASCFGDLPRDGEVIITCSEKTAGIFKASFPEFTFVTLDAPQLLSINKNDVAIAAGSLPGMYRTSKERFPRHRYLRVPETNHERVAPFLAALPAGLKVGISWRGGTEATRLRLRSLPLDPLAELLKVPGVTWVNLQYGDCAADLERLQSLSGREIHHAAALHADYADTAALAEGLDLVLSVCTAIVHLAGALGKEVWVLAPHVPEWRYGLNFRFMPWYPQVEVFRQAQQGGWTSLLREIRMRLERRLEQ